MPSLLQTFLFLLLLTLTPFARSGPRQIDVLGLVPGISDLRAVQETRIDGGNDPGVAKFEIGGHRIPCAMSFIDERLASLICFTGTGERGLKYTEATNLLVHSDLAQGFTKKLGNPDSVRSVAVATRAGVPYRVNVVTWTDRYGNRLKLESIVGRIDTGTVRLESAEIIKRRIDEEVAAEKKF